MKHVIARTRRALPAHWVPVVVLALVAIGPLAARIMPASRPQPVTVDASPTQRVTCPVAPLTGQVIAAAPDGAVDPTPLRDADGPQQVQGNPGQSVAASFIAANTASQWATSCTSSTADTWLITPTGATSELFLVNSEGTQASVNLTLYGPKGQIQAAGSTGIVVGSKSSREIALSVLAGTDRVIGVHLTTDQGRVSAYVRSSALATGDFANPTQASKESVLAGIPAGASNVTLLLTNPGDDRAHVTVTGLTADGPLSLAGGETDIAAGTTTSVDLTSAVAGQAMALEVTSDSDIVAGASVTAAGDLAIITAADTTHTSVGQVASAGATLAVTNPTDAAADIGVTVNGATQKVSLDAKTSTQIEVKQAGWVQVDTPGIAALRTPGVGLGITRLEPLPDASTRVSLALDPRTGR